MADRCPDSYCTDVINEGPIPSTQSRDTLLGFDLETYQVPTDELIPLQ